MKKIIALALSLMLLFSLAACSGNENSGSKSGDGTYTIGICQLTTHPALDAATQGFQDAIVAALGKDAVTFVHKDAAEKQANCDTIIDRFISDKVDLILANATLPLQSAANKVEDIPVLGTSVTDYASALSIENWTGTVGYNISGTSDLAPLDQQANMIKELFPDAKTVGLLYCSGETNSIYQVTEMEKYLTELGLSVETFSFVDANDLALVTQAACGKSDVLYVPTDNTAAKYTEIIANVVIPAKVPVVAGESGICSGCGVATLSIDYYDLGYATGEMAVDILTGEKNISEMPIQFAPEVSKLYNADICAELGITAPEGYAPLS